jgi:dipeptidyl-peptidase-4
MQTPQLNPEGYSITSVLQNAGNITQRFMLIHGTGDDNVHFQNSAELVKQLIPTRLQFDVMYYPNRDHSINTDGMLLCCCQFRPC